LAGFLLFAWHAGNTVNKRDSGGRAMDRWERGLLAMAAILWLALLAFVATYLLA
jgi:hypothetical protein